MYAWTHGRSTVLGDPLDPRELGSLFQWEVTNWLFWNGETKFTFGTVLSVCGISSNVAYDGRKVKKDVEGKDLTTRTGWEGPVGSQGL